MSASSLLVVPARYSSRTAGLCIDISVSLLYGMVAPKYNYSDVILWGPLRSAVRNGARPGVCGRLRDMTVGKESVRGKLKATDSGIQLRDLRSPRNRASFLQGARGRPSGCLDVHRGEVVLEDAGWGCPAECSVGSVVIVEMHEPGVGAGPLGF